MKYVVCVKLTPDTEELDEIQPEDVGSGHLDATMVLNPWDEFAVEEALQLQERFEGETIAITAGKRKRYRGAEARRGYGNRGSRAALR